MAEKIFVIGATGRVGGELIKILIENGERVIAATRRPAEILSRFQNSVEAAEFDYEKPHTFASALAGADKVFLTVRPGDNKSDIFAMPFIDEARKAKVKLIVDVTAMGVEQDETFMLRKLEKYIEKSGIPYTHLRPNWFMQNFSSGPMYMEIKSTGTLHLPAADAKVSFIDVRDIALAAFTALTKPGHGMKAYTLTGGESLNHFQAAEKISGVSGKKITYIPISEEIAQMGLVKAGVPAELVDRWTDFYRKVRHGLCSPVSNDIEMLCGRQPISFDRFAEDYAESWQ